ncbi:uncharacterized protein [Ptychodera flava]|uniref:uncharacterized protein n=1 Tax=Ptychodera flava TaxID=63121 RepID=UPI00396A43B0
MADITRTTPAESEAGHSNLPQWFVDQRNTHHHQAAYLAKIYQLKHALEIENQSSMKTAVQRVSQRGAENHTGKPQRTVKWRPGLGMSTAETMTPRDRHLERIRRSRQRPPPPLLDPLRGQTLLETTPSPTPRRSNSEPKLSSLARPDDTFPLIRKNSFMEAFVNGGIDAQVPTPARYSEFGNTAAVSSLMKYITPSASIPNIGRRARPSPADRIMGFAVRKANNPHDFEFKQKGRLYKYTDRLGTRKLMKADSDELDLTPETYKFDLPYEDELSRQYRKGDRILPAPNTTPVPLSELSGREFDDAVIKQVKWSNDVVLLRRPKQNQQTAVLPERHYVRTNSSPTRARSKPKSSAPAGGKRPQASRSFPQITDNSLSQWQVDESNADIIPEFDCAIRVEERCSSKDSTGKRQIHIDMPSLQLETTSPVPSKDISPLNSVNRPDAGYLAQESQSSLALQTEPVSPIPNKDTASQLNTSSPSEVWKPNQGIRSANTR